MECDERDGRRRKVEAGRAKLAQFQQRKTKGDSSSSKKKASKRKSAAVHAAVTEKEEEHAVASLDGELPSDLEQSVESRAGSSSTEGGAGALDAKDSRSSLATDRRECEVPRAQGKIKMLEEKLAGKQEAVDLLSQQELEMAVQERDKIIVQLTSTLQQERQNHAHDQQEALLLASQMHDLQHQLQENSELLKSKMPAKGRSSRPRPPAASPLQSPPEPHTPMQNIQDKENKFAQTEEHLESAIQELAQVIEEKEGTVSSLWDQLSLDEAVASLQCALSVKDSEIKELKQEKRDCVEKSQVHPQKEVWRPLQDLRWDMLEEKPQLEVTEVGKTCGDAVDEKHRKGGKPTRPEAPPVTGPRDRQPQSLGGINVNLKGQLQESDPRRNGLCAIPESQMAAFQKERDETEWNEKGMPKDLKRKPSSTEIHSEESWDTNGDEGNWGEEVQKLSSHIQGLNGKLLQEPENSRVLLLEPVEDVTAWDTKSGPSEQEERGSQGVVDAQKAELERVQSQLCLQPGEPLCLELEYQTILKRCSVGSEEEEEQSLRLGVSEDDTLVEAGTIDGETSGEGLMMEGAGDLMEKYLVCTERDHLNASETPEYFDIETALQTKSERGSLGFPSGEWISGFGEKRDFNVLSEGNSAQVESLADPVTNVFSQGDLSEIYEVMDEDKIYLMHRCVKFNQLLGEKELALKNFSPEDQRG
uniref:Pericentrin-like isoform X2 n=1 Tax=Phascolarctos cinereus TaxID=38626 RepID=A0A6P5J410_PHACI|nr:pericentrin-like isoform X2 [Phascolarctos cinereus]